MFPFTSIGPFDRTEKKALLLAFLFCALFIVSFSLSMSAQRARKTPLTILSRTPLTTLDEAPVRSYVDQLEQFRAVSENFRDVDFNNFSYGDYVGSGGKPVSLTLNEGKMWDATGWFNLQNVYYKDLTGDGRPEAIVKILRLRCSSGSCDGGSDLFYVYTTHNGKLKNIWQYETGSYAYGCGLKSFTLRDKQIVMELFGRCGSPVFEFDGSRFRRSEFSNHGSDGF